MEIIVFSSRFDETSGVYYGCAGTYRSPLWVHNDFAATNVHDPVKPVRLEKSQGIEEESLVLTCSPTKFVRFEPR